jgi:hypothetical protein
MRTVTAYARILSAFYGISRGNVRAQDVRLQHCASFGVSAIGGQPNNNGDNWRAIDAAFTLPKNHSIRLFHVMYSGAVY